MSWRLGRRLYCAARGEPHVNHPQSNGEIDLAQRVIAGTTGKDVLTIIDVGANLGDWTRPVLDRLPPDRVDSSRLRFFAFEPVPETRNILLGNLAVHPRGAMVSVEKFALSSATGVAEMATYGAEAGSHTMCQVDKNSATPSGVVSVEVNTLTNFAGDHKIEYIDLVKIDTEGFDRLVLEGALPLFAAERIGVAQFEYNHRWVATRSYLKDVFDMIEGLPYRVARLMPHGLELIDAWHPELERFFEANFAVVHASGGISLSLHQGHFDASNTYA